MLAHTRRCLFTSNQVDHYISHKKSYTLNPCPAELYFCIGFNCIFRHSKLELLTQFPASNDEKYYYLWKKYMSKIKLLDQLSIY